MKWEVRTMRSGTSCFNSTVYRKNLTRFWPIWAVNLAFWVILLPLDGLLVISSTAGEPDRGLRSMISFGREIGFMAVDVGLIFAVIAGLGTAMAVCSYLYFHRATNFMGALPIRREGQFVSSYLAGLTMLVSPNVLVFLLTLAVEAAGGCVQWTPLLFWLGYLCAAELFFFSFAVCLGQFTGHLLAQPVYYGVFNALVWVVILLISYLLQSFFFGFAGLSGAWMTVARLATPVAVFAEVGLESTRLESGFYTYTVENGHLLWIYAIVGLVLAGCALLLNRRRHMETAGDAVAVRAMRPVFRYGVAVCTGLCLGFLTSAVVGVESRGGLLVLMIVWAVIGCFAAQMVLDKSFKVMKKWKGSAAVALAFLLFFGAAEMDLFGYESYVPDVGQVESVTVTGLNGYTWDSGNTATATLTDPEEIRAVIALHEKIVEYGEDGEVDSGDRYSRQVTYTVSYTLRSGRVVDREYSVPMGDEMLALAQTIRDMETVRRQSYNLDHFEDLYARGWLEYAAYHGEEALVLKDYGMGESKNLLWEAVMADFAAGRIGCADLEWPYEDGKGDRSVEFEFSVPFSETDADIMYHSTYIQFAVTDAATETMKVIEAVFASLEDAELSQEDILAGVEG